MEKSLLHANTQPVALSEGKSEYEQTASSPAIREIGGAALRKYPDYRSGPDYPQDLFCTD